MKCLLEPRLMIYHGGELMSFNIKTTAHINRLNKVNYIQDIFAFCFSKWRCVSQRGRSLWKDYIRDKSIFIHTKEQDLVLNFYRFLSLEKLGHRMALFWTLWSLQSKGEQACGVWVGIGEGAKEQCISYKLNCLTISRWLKPNLTRTNLMEKKIKLQVNSWGYSQTDISILLTA